MHQRASAPAGSSIAKRHHRRLQQTLDFAHRGKQRFALPLAQWLQDSLGQSVGPPVELGALFETLGRKNHAAYAAIFRAGFAWR